MRIGLFSYFYFPTVNGVVTSMDNLRCGLEELGHEVYIFAPKSSKHHYPPEVKIIDFPSVNIKAKGFFLPIPLTLSLKIFREIKKLKLDIIHTQHPFYLGESAFFYAKRLKIPLVFTHHTVYDLLGGSYLPFFKKATSKRINKSVRNFASRCDGVIAPNKVTKNKYLRGLKVRTAIIPPGVDLEKYKKEFRDKKEPKKEAVTFLTVGRLSKEKNIEFLIRAFALIVKENKNCHFLIVGDGPARKKLEELTESKNLKSRIKFIGEVKHKEIADYYKKADIFLFSSLADVLPMIIPEALAAGLPFIALNTPEMRSAIKHGRNGFLVPHNLEKFAETAKKLIENPKLREKISFNARKSANYYSYQLMARRAVSFYKKVIKSHS